MNVVEPLIETFGVWFVVSTWLFIPTILSIAILSASDRYLMKFVGFLCPYLIWPVSLWMLKIIYDVVPAIRVIFGIDVTDLSVFGYLVIFLIGFLNEVTREITGVLEQ